MLLWFCCCLLLPLWDSVIILCFVVSYFVSIPVLNHPDVEKRAGCFALPVFMVYRDCCVALPRGTTGLSTVCDCGIS